MNFDHDAFISYSHRDNTPLPGPGQNGWVTMFGAVLKNQLGTRLGKDARVWIDPALKGNEVFATEISDRLAASALLVSILSPSYVQSSWCKREMDEFCAAAARTGGLTLGNLNRVVKVIKLPPAPQPEPELMQGMIGYKFYDERGGFPMELQPDGGGDSKEQYLCRITRLAYEITQALLRLNPSPAVRDLPTDRPAPPPVFLADCGRDQQEARERLATELRVNGHEVLQLQPLPETEGALQLALEPLLDRCALSVHLVGDSVGLVPGGASGRSLVMLENSMAAQRCRNSTLRRVIWLPGHVQGERREQRDFITRLQTSADEQYGADLLRGDFETLKGEIHARLRQSVALPLNSASATPAGPAKVHLLMSEADREAAVPLIKLLQARGLEVTIPVFVGASAAVRKTNSDLIRASDMTILFYGVEDELWKHDQIKLRKRVIAPDSARPHRAWTCLMPPLTEDKKLLLQIGGSEVINGLNGLSIALLLPAIKALAPTESGR